MPLYKLYLAGLKFVSRFYAPQKIRHHFIHPFARRYLTHIIIVVIAVMTVAANLNAYETRREDFGQTSVIASLVANEDLGAIEEEGPIIGSKKISHYLSQTGVSLQPQIIGLQEEETAELTTVAGGSAVVRPILSPLEEQLRQRDKIVYYEVQPGDTLSEIAAKFGVSVNTVLWENNLTAYSLIRPGDKLAILPISGIRHKVAKGDTLAKIAKKYGVDADKILEFNKIASAEDISVGETLMIPGGQKISAPAPAYTLRSFYQPAQYQNAPVLTSSGRMMWPTTCRRITQYFGWRHSAVDIACGYGVPIYAAANARVIKAQGGWNGGYGNMIMLDFGNGVQAIHGHLSAIYVSVGQTVAKGQTIGAMGSTGRSTGPHLHFEVRVGGVRRNPLYYIK